MKRTPIGGAGRLPAMRRLALEMAENTSVISAALQVPLNSV